MNFGATPGDQALLAPILLRALAIIPLLIIGTALRATRLVPKPAHRILVLVLLLGGGSALAGGALERAASPAIGLVAKKEELVSARVQGDWQQTLQMQLFYRLDGAAPAPRAIQFADSATAYLPDADTASVSLDLLAAPFDGARQGAALELRAVPIWRSVALVWPAAARPWDTLPLPGIAAAGALLALLLLLPRGWRAGLAAALLLAAVPLWPAAELYGYWHTMRGPAAAPLHAEATVTSMTRVTAITPFPCDEAADGCLFYQNVALELPQPYDIIQLRYTPAGASDSVTAIAAVDADSELVRVGAAVPIDYAAAAPRSVMISGVPLRHADANVAAFARLLLGMAVVGALLLGAWAWLHWRIDCGGRKTTASSRSVR